ncbi:hypothetical protein BP5796_05721 [Coleophoma crateriformis]|uniref:rhamnogalacturonan endolyase n=1 Tax=Coleophoma crateriformis TaxID=565419 RepID=A0A3D8RUW8_9HELO|nr:hypothetical protein BP5796_05721 [Coleophoma crateriformis]
MRFFRSVLLGALCFPSIALAAWGYTDDGTNYVVDVGSLLVFKVSKSTGDITSMVYNGVETNGYSGKNTQVESGLGASTVTIQKYTTPANIIKITVVHGTLIQTYIARYGNNNIYMFTRKGDASVAALRFIVRIPSTILPKAITDADYYDEPLVDLEETDVTRSSTNSYTKAKHYSGDLYGRTMDYDYVGKASSTIGMYMIRSNHEKASGGPFFRSLLARSAVTEEDIYEILYYNMGTTDPERFGLQGPYVLSFTSGTAPNSNLFARKADYSWMDSLGITDYVPASGRGAVLGVGIASMKSGYTYVAALSNTEAQYWGTASASTGAFSITGALPGTYTLTIYKGELAVYTSSVVVTAGAELALHTITPDNDPSDTTAIWRIGDWDGTPAGFTNFDASPMLPTYMHPSDFRLASWTPPNYIVGTSTAAGAMPGYMWVDVNNGHLVYFRLSAAQTAAAHTVRIGITQAFANGRPRITINSWTSAIPAATSQASTRSLTVGTYRGTNTMLTYDVPASAFVATGGWNIMTINVVSGSSGTTYLSPGISLDCIDFI